MVETGKGQPSQEAEPQRGAKQARVGQTAAEKRHDSQVRPSAWTPTLMLDRASLLVNVSIREF